MHPTAPSDFNSLSQHMLQPLRSDLSERWAWLGTSVKKRPLPVLARPRCGTRLGSAAHARNSFGHTLHNSAQHEAADVKTICTRLSPVIYTVC